MVPTTGHTGFSSSRIVTASEDDLVRGKGLAVGARAAGGWRATAAGSAAWGGGASEAAEAGFGLSSGARCAREWRLTWDALTSCSDSSRMRKTRPFAVSVTWTVESSITSTNRLDT